MVIAVHQAHHLGRAAWSAVEALQAGGLVAYPTDTAYGLGCDVESRRAIDRLYQLKRRDPKKPLSLICADLAMVAEYAVVDNAAHRLLRRLLPGPYTFVLPAAPKVPRALMPRRRTVGVRVPDHPVPLALAEKLGRALVTSTACIEDEPPLDEAWEIEQVLGHGLAVVMDGGAVPPGRLSTVVDLTGDDGPVVLREGVGPVDFA